MGTILNELNEHFTAITDLDGLESKHKYQKNIQN